MAHPYLRSGMLRSAILACSALALSIPAAPAMASPLDWLGSNQIKGSGALQKQTRQLSHFNGVALALPGHVELRLGNTESVTIETDDNLLAQIDTVIDNGTLRIRSVRRDTDIRPSALKIVVQAKNVERLSLGGSGSIGADTLRAPQLTIEVGGSGNIDVRQLEGKNVTVALGGSGNLKIGGRADQLSVAIGGSGNADTGRLAAREVHVSIGGSGVATVWAGQALDVNIGGSGNVNYYGNPQLSQSTQGSGSVQRIASAPN